MTRSTHNTIHGHATIEQLGHLLYGDEENLAIAEVSSHVESCEVCQKRLQELHPLSDVEEEISLLLPSGIEQEVVIGPPSHPEMLGRLGRYEIERKIGAGGMGVVFKAFDTELNRPVAIKVLAPYLARNGAARQRFGRESRAAAAVVHEHVVAIHNVESDGETPFIVMQYVSGESLQARVQRLGPLSIEEILRIGIQTAAGLAAAHEQGIVHRDVKPENILLENSVDRVLLTDFGLARTVDDASLTRTGVIAGTPSYMSPEQANGDAIDHRTDLFSFGSVLYFMATGHPPFRAERAMGILHRICTAPHRPVWQLNAKVPQELSHTIDRLLEKNPAKRIVSSGALRETLTRILANVQSGRPAVGVRLNTWMLHHKRTVRTAVSCALVMVAIASTSVVFLMDFDLSNLSILKPREPDSVVKPTKKSMEYKQPAAPEPSSASIAMDASDRNEFDRSLLQLNQELDRLDMKPQDAESQTDTWNAGLHSIDRILIELERSN